jgi:D-glycero-alpha-D-manno-heptose 1-phosphate guanylyltransferase
MKKSSIQIAILAGGLGTRLRSEVSNLPKVMAPLNKRPFLEYLLDFYITQNVDSIFLSVGYKKESIIHHFKNEYKGVSIFYNEEKKPLGTGGAILDIMQHSKLDSQKSICITNGDTFLNISLQKLKDFHQSNDMDITLALVPMKNFERYGSVEVNKDRVVSFKEKSYVKSGFINGGTYMIKKTLFKKFQQEKKFSFESFLQENIKHLKVGAYVLKNSYFIDIGIPSDYKKAQIDFKELF